MDSYTSDMLIKYITETGKSQITYPKEWFHFCLICDGPAENPESKEDVLIVGRDGRYYCGEGVIDIASYVRRMPEDVVCSI